MRGRAKYAQQLLQVTNTDDYTEQEINRIAGNVVDLYLEPYTGSITF
jgi:hypothetical protein